MLDIVDKTLQVTAQAACNPCHFSPSSKSSPFTHPQVVPLPPSTNRTHIQGPYYMIKMDYELPTNHMGSFVAVPSVKLEKKALVDIKKVLNLLHTSGPG